MLQAATFFAGLFNFADILLASTDARYVIDGGLLFTLQLAEAFLPPPSRWM